jgi:hypothetical protein
MSLQEQALLVQQQQHYQHQEQLDFGLQHPYQQHGVNAKEVQQWGAREQLAWQLEAAEVMQQHQQLWLDRQLQQQQRQHYQQQLWQQQQPAWQGDYYEQQQVLGRDYGQEEAWLLQQQQQLLWDHCYQAEPGALQQAAAAARDGLAAAYRSWMFPAAAGGVGCDAHGASAYHGIPAHPEVPLSPPAQTSHHSRSHSRLVKGRSRSTGGKLPGVEGHGASDDELMLSLLAAGVCLEPIDSYLDDDSSTSSPKGSDGALLSPRSCTSSRASQIW